MTLRKWFGVTVTLLIGVVLLSVLVVGPALASPGSNELAQDGQWVGAPYDVTAFAPPVGPESVFDAVTPAAGVTDFLISEDFEAGLVPPTGWSVVTSTAKTWAASSSYANGSAYGAVVEWGANQDEWLLSPVISTGAAMVTGTLVLWSEGSIYWCRDTYNNCDLRVYLVVGAPGGADDIVIGRMDDTWTDNWTWAQATYTLTGIVVTDTTRLGLRYTGSNGADAAVDDIYIEGQWLDMTPPTVPVASASITGPSTGVVGTSYGFTAVVSPANATLPITYTWSPAPASGQGTANATYSWTSAGNKPISVTVSNVSGSAVGAATISISEGASVPVSGASIVGPSSGIVGVTYGFTATFAPVSATVPITYSWSPAPASGQGTANATYSWATAGSKPISVTVSNAFGSAAGSTSVSISVPVTGTAVQGPTSGIVGTSYAFTATVSPAEATLPFTYAWSPAPNTGQGTANATYSWSTAGTKPISVTVSNVSGSAVGHKSIDIASLLFRVFAPFVARNSP